MKKTVKVTVTGAAGQIGYALLFRLASGHVFGPDVNIDLRLLEVTPALASLKGVVMELEDCAFPLLVNVTATDDANVAMKDTHWAILVGAFPRKAGMERADLLEKNAAIFKAQGKAINDHASSDVRIFVVGNPCNTNAMIAMNAAKNIPKDRFFAMTLLDQNRAVTQLAKKAGVPITEVKKMVIWGNHSATQYPDFHHATISGKPATEVITDSAWLSEQFIPLVQKRGAAVIEARGSSSAASAANAIIDAIKSLITETPADQLYSMCCHSSGQYGVDEGLIFSFPCRTKNGKVEIVTGLQHNAFSQAKLKQTLDELRQERDTVKKLGLLV